MCKLKKKSLPELTNLKQFSSDKDKYKFITVLYT